MKSGWSAAAALSGALLAAGPLPAQEESCRSSYVETQRLQRAARFRAARREAVACGQDGCTETVRAHCIAWLGDIERALPTLLIDARDPSGTTLTGLRIEANGELLTERWDGRALELDPGETTLRLQQGERIAEAHTVIREAEKYRTLQVRFPGPAAPLAAAAPRIEATAPRIEAAALTTDATGNGVADATSPPPASYVLGGLSLAGLATFVVLGASGYAAERELRERCAGECRSTEVSSVSTRYLVADVGLGVGVIAGIAAASFWIWAPAGADGPRAALGPGSVRWQATF